MMVHFIICYTWVKNVTKHRAQTKRCKLAKTKMSAREVLIQGDITIEIDDILKKEVAFKMKDDEINNDVILKDALLLQYGKNSERILETNSRGENMLETS